MSLTPLGDMGIALKADIDDYQKSMATASDTTALLSGSVRNLAAGFRNMGLAITAASGIAAAGMFTLIDRAEQVNQKYREIQTLTRHVTDAQAEYRGMVQEVSSEMAVQGGEAETLDALYQSLSAGISESANAQEDFLRSAAALAEVGQADLQTTVDVLTTGLNAYNLEASEASRVSNTLFATVQQGKVRMDELGSIMGRLFATGSQLNAQMEDIGASIAVMTAQGEEARRAATALEGVMRKILKPTQQMERLLFEVAAKHDGWNEKMQESIDQISKQVDAVQEIRSEISKYEEDIANLGDKVNKQRLREIEIEKQIQKIKAEAAKQNRDLTSAEEQQIESLNEKLEDQREQTDMLRLQQEELRVQRELANSELDEAEDKLDKNKTALEEKHGAIQNLVVEEVGFAETLSILSEVADDAGVSLAELFNEARAQRGAFMLMGDGGENLINTMDQMMQKNKYTREELQKLREEGKITEEEFQQMASVMTMYNEEFDETPEHAKRQAVNALGVSLRSLGNLLATQALPYIRNLTDQIKWVTERIQNMDQQTKEGISTFMFLATTIGLVVGPLMLIGGQIALIATTLGSAFIPVVAAVSAVVGGMAYAFHTAAKGGEDAEAMFSRMRQIIPTVKSVGKDFISALTGEIIPAFQVLGKGILDVVVEMGVLIANLMGGKEGMVSFKDILIQLGHGFLDLVEWTGRFLSANDEIIAKITLITGAIIALITGIGAVAPAIAKIISYFGKFKSILSGGTFLGPIFGIIDALSIAGGAILKFGSIIVSASSFLSNFVGGLSALYSVGGTVTSAISYLVSGLLSLNPIVLGIIAVVSLAVGAFLAVKNGVLGARESLQRIITDINDVKNDFIKMGQVILNITQRTFAPLIDIIGLLGKQTGGLSGDLKSLGVTVLPIVAGALQVAGAAALWLLSGVTGLISFITSMMVPILKIIGPIIINLLAVPIYTAVGAIGAIIVAARLLVQALEWVVNAIIIVAQAIWKFITEPQKAFEEMVSEIETIVEDLATDAKQWGKNVINSFADGMREKVDEVTDAAEEAAKGVKDYLGFSSPPPKGPGKEGGGPKQWGANSTESFYDGMISKKGKVESGSEEIAGSVNFNPDTNFEGDMKDYDEYNVEDQMEGQPPSAKDLKTNGEMPKQADQSTDITIEEKAVYFEEGAFEGVSDEELPEKVRDIVDDSMGEIVDILQAKGKTTER